MYWNVFFYSPFFVNIIINVELTFTLLKPNFILKNK